MKTTLKVGDKAKGFLFANQTDDIVWVEEMTEYIGQEGEIVHVNVDYFYIEFDNAIWIYPLSLMHLAVVEEQPKIIEIDVTKVEKFEAFNGKEWCNKSSEYLKYRFTMKDENKIKIKQEIKDLEEKIIELKKQL